MIDLATLGLIALAVGAVLFGPIVVSLIREEGPATVTWFMDRYVASGVNTSADAPPDIMSRSGDGDVAVGLSVLRQTALQTDSAPDRQPVPTITRDVMLDTYKLLRKYNIPREEARPILKAAGIPLDNNLWVQAAPAPAKDEDAILTPIAHRPTKASYYPDEPELEFNPPTR